MISSTFEHAPEMIRTRMSSGLIALNALEKPSSSSEANACVGREKPLTIVEKADDARLYVGLAVVEWE